MTKRAIFVVFLALAVIPSSFFASGLVLAATAPSLGTAQSFAVLGGSTVTNTGPSVIYGDLGVSPGSAVTGFPPGIVTPPGTIHAADAAAAQAQSDVTIAYNSLAGESYDVDLTDQDLGGLTLVSGVYFFSSSAQLTGTLTLDAENNPNSVFIFQIGSTLTTASNSSVVVINAPPNFCNKYWQVGSSATLGTGTAFQGNILALQSITLNTGASLYGRALARNGAVTMDSNQITVPCGALLSLTKTVSPATYSEVGDVLTYTLVATNDGNITLANVSISDSGLTITGSTPAQPTTLAPGAILTVTGTRTITQGDIDSGSLNNTATASGTSPAGAPVSATASATATAQGEGISLSPTGAINAVGTEHTVTAKVQNATGAAVPEVNVTFIIIAGPNKDLTGDAVTDASGLATFTYSSAVEGTDTIQACYDGYVPAVQSTAVQSQICSNVVTKTWQAGVPPVPELSTIVLFGIGLLMLGGLVVLVRRKASAA